MDPIHEENGAWYFWEETWAHRQGPFEARIVAEMAFAEYCENYL